MYVHAIADANGSALPSRSVAAGPRWLWRMQQAPAKRPAIEKGRFMRTARVKRTTKETDVAVEVKKDGAG